MKLYSKEGLNRKNLNIYNNKFFQWHIHTPSNKAHQLYNPNFCDLCLLHLHMLSAWPTKSTYQRKLPPKRQIVNDHHK